MHRAFSVNAAARTTAELLVRSLRVALRDLYRTPRAGDRETFVAADNVILRSAIYRRLRSGIVAHRRERQTIHVIKRIHTVIFALMISSVLHLSYAGLRDRFTRATYVSLGAIIVEVLAMTTNQGRCPLTIVVEDLGDQHGSVPDSFLPGRIARHIPHISSALIGTGFTALALRRIFDRTCEKQLVE